MDNLDEYGGYAIAVVGMALRVPGANTPGQYWHNLKNGIESVEFYDDETLLAQGVMPEQLKHPHYVKAGAPLDGVDQFDPDFFGFNPKDAGILDPQHRHFYECAWEALENAGHVPSMFDGAIGVFAGCGMGAYFAFNLLSNPELRESVGLFLLRHTGNDKDFLSTRVSYNLNLKGPSINVQTACSTSSVATHLACQSLLNEECDMALAGGVTIEIPHGHGYLYKAGEILSPDGHCRPFDEQSKGTIFGSGAGVIVLRRLEDAIADGDHVHAVICGSAVNNDGSGKVSYLAPSVDGQAEAIAEALAIADLDADSIGYVECHGTGTPVGDPIEVSALTEAFSQSSDRTGFCGIGSVKSNIGHLDTAAGVAGIIKTVLALENAELPPSLNFEAPNPEIDFVHSPFYVNHTLKPWTATEGETRRAAVNSLGVGGTNAFIILEEPPKPVATESHARDCHLLTLSAKNRKSLDAACERLADHFEQNADFNIADAAYTLFCGREAFEHRRVLACRDLQEAISLLRSKDQRRVFTHNADDVIKSVVFMFPGGGAQYYQMGRGLYDSESVFKQYLDQGFAALAKRSTFDYKGLLFGEQQDLSAVKETLKQPSIQLPLIFIIEYALAKLWISLGVEPRALIGHSMGENTAACLAGVFEFDDAIGLVHLRGQIMDEAPRGGMLSVELPAQELRQHLGDSLDLAGINSPNLSVASGAAEDLDALGQKLDTLGIENQRIRIDIAAHSRLLDGGLERFRAYLQNISLNEPSIPIVSNFTGTWLTAVEAVDPDYWVNHLRNTVRFSEGIEILLEEEAQILLEVGPGTTLGSLARQNPATPGQRVLSSLRHSEDETPDTAYFMSVLGRLWAAGLPVDYKIIWPEARRKVPLPTYAFQHQSYWIDPGEGSQAKSSAFVGLEKLEDKSQWLRKPVWVQQGVLSKPKTAVETWLVFLDDVGYGEALCERLRSWGHQVITVKEGDAYYQVDREQYRLSPELGLEAYAALVKDLHAAGTFPDKLLHLWLLTKEETFRPGSSFFHRNQEHGFYSLFFFARAMADEGLMDRALDMYIYANGMQSVSNEPLSYPEKATVLGPCQIIPREFPQVRCAAIDVYVPPDEKSRFGKNKAAPLDKTLINMMGVELRADVGDGQFVYRNGVRWALCYDHNNDVECEKKPSPRLREGGVYLFTGGLGGVGFVMAKQLAEDCAAKLILVNRTPLPERSEWAEWLRDHVYDDPISVNINKVRELEKLGADVLVLSGDVTDVTRMRDIVQSAEDKFGLINGVVHAAGVVNDNLIQMKHQADIEEVFAPKVYGTLVLDSLFDRKALDFMVLFSSTSTVIAPIGQIDYVAANAFLNAYAQKRNAEQPGYTVAVNWGIWNEVGMAANTALAMGYGAQQNAVLEKKPVSYAWFDEYQELIKNGQSTHLFTAHYEPKQMWVLDQHRTKADQALLPGTAYLELARAALYACGEKAPFDVKELIFLKALYIPDAESRAVRVKLTKTISGYDFAIQSEAADEQGNSGWQTHAEAVIELIDQPPSAKALAELQSRFDFSVSEENSPVIQSSQEDHLNFGEHWQVLRDAKYQRSDGGAAEALARLRLNDACISALEEHYLHPGLLDIATGYAMRLIKGYVDSGGSASGLTEVKASRLWVPVSYKRFRYMRPLTQQIYSWVRNHDDNSVDDDFASFDITLYDSKGNMLVDVQKLTIKQMREAVDFSVVDTHLSLERDATSGMPTELRQLSPAEVAFQHNLSQGILPKEGVGFFKQVVDSGESPRLIVSSLSLEGLIDEAAAAAAGLHQEETGAKFSRPDLDNDYLAPRDDIEKTLVGFWEELLGVDQVGVEDSFFDLGGHSLIAVRLFSKIQQTYDVDYPISILFEASTIASCAALIRDAVGDTATNSEATETTHKARYTHLVPMHEGSTKQRSAKPFFLVAGMFGNVLNLRHLAQLVGSDRPFYGLQARGLYGDHEPHETFEEMAVDYIKELKTVQPEGPYYLGGFSGGGITAYEIAKQLIAKGDKVEKIIMLDTPLPTSPPLSSVDRMAIHWQRLKSKGPGYFTEWAKSRYEWEMQKFRGRLENDDQGKPFDFQSQDIELAFYRALGRYTVDPLNVEVVLFRPKLDETYKLPGGRSANVDRQIVVGDNGWTPYVRSLKIFEVPGDHDSMVLEPNVRVLAAKFRDQLDD